MARLTSFAAASSDSISTLRNGRYGASIVSAIMFLSKYPISSITYLKAVFVSVKLDFDVLYDG